MALKHFVTHQISKDPQDPAATLNCSEHEAELESEAVAHFYAQTAAQLKSVFTQRSGKRYGVFHPEITQVRALIQDWQHDRESFMAMTRRVSKHFANTLDNSEHAIEGYLAFFLDQLADDDRFYIFHLRRKTSVAVNPDMSLTETSYLDFSNTGFGVLLNLTDWASDDDSKYLTFSFGRGDKPLQNQFAECIGFTDTLNTAEETEAFLEIVDEFSHTLPADQGFEYKAKVVDYCMEQDMRGEPVVFEELADYMATQVKAEPAKAFAHYIVDKQKERQQKTPESLSPEQLAAQGADQKVVAEAIKTELIPDRKKLKGFIRYTGKNKDLSLSFSANMLEKEEIVFDGVSNELRIKKVPESLLKQLKQ